jgi:microcystin-dependent protein
MAMGAIAWAHENKPLLTTSDAGINEWSSGDSLSANDLNHNFATIESQIGALESIVDAIPGATDGGVATVPVGTVSAYAGPVVPNGWLLCNGSAVSRTEYANLMQSIGVAWGAGDNLTTFNVPDLRGYFLRGIDPSGTIDSTARTLGSIEASNMPNHSHQIEESSLHNAAYCPGGFGYVNTAGCTPATFMSDGPSSISGETRPINVAVYYIIKT